MPSRTVQADGLRELHSAQCLLCSCMSAPSAGLWLLPGLAFVSTHCSFVSNNLQEGVGCSFIIDISVYFSFLPSGPLVGRQKGEVLSGPGAASACVVHGLSPPSPHRFSKRPRTSPCGSCNSSLTSVSQRCPIIN